MISTNKTNIKTNFSGGEKLGISANSIAFKAVIRNLYKEPRLAAFRELSANAIDANVAAGKDPYDFTVSLPTEENGYEFYIRDNGTGMDEQGIEDYKDLFNSTKRDTNTQIGFWGLGSKTPLAVVDSYTLSTACAGEETKRIYAIYFNEYDEPHIDIISNDQPSNGWTGTEVRYIDSDTDSSEYYKAVELFAAGHCGNLPKSLNGYELNADALIKKFSKVKKTCIEDDLRDDGYLYSCVPDCMVIMGGIVYPIEKSSLTGASEITKNMAAAVLYVPMGSVSITAARDGLVYNEDTIKVINSTYLSRYFKKLEASFKNLNGVSNLKKIHDFFDRWSSVSHAGVFEINALPEPERAAANEALSRYYDMEDMFNKIEKELNDKGVCVYERYSMGNPIFHIDTIERLVKYTDWSCIVPVDANDEKLKAGLSAKHFSQYIKGRLPYVYDKYPTVNSGHIVFVGSSLDLTLFKGCIRDSCVTIQDFDGLLPKKVKSSGPTGNGHLEVMVVDETGNTTVTTWGDYVSNVINKPAAGKNVKNFYIPVGANKVCIMTQKDINNNKTVQDAIKIDTTMDLFYNDLVVPYIIGADTSTVFNIVAISVPNIRRIQPEKAGLKNIMDAFNCVFSKRIQLATDIIKANDFSLYQYELTRMVLHRMDSVDAYYKHFDKDSEFEKLVGYVKSTKEAFDKVNWLHSISAIALGIIRNIGTVDTVSRVNFCEDFSRNIRKSSYDVNRKEDEYFKPLRKEYPMSWRLIDMDTIEYFNMVDFYKVNYKG